MLIAAEGINGGVAQLGERLLCKQEVTGSIPVVSTNSNGLEARKRSLKDFAMCVFHRGS